MRTLLVIFIFITLGFFARSVFTSNPDSAREAFIKPPMPAFLPVSMPQTGSK